jgi:hypothetical protein
MKSKRLKRFNRHNSNTATILAMLLPFSPRQNASIEETLEKVRSMLVIKSAENHDKITQMVEHKK